MLLTDESLRVRSHAAVILGELGDPSAIGLLKQAANRVIFGDVTTGPSNDLQVASNLARAMVTRPLCVLADEPTGNLDREAGSAVFEELLALQKRHAFVALVATHDERLAGRCDRVVRLEGGRI